MQSRLRRGPTEKGPNPLQSEHLGVWVHRRRFNFLALILAARKGKPPVRPFEL